MNSIANCQPSKDTFVLSPLSDEKCSPHGIYSPAEQNKDSQTANSTEKDNTLNIDAVSLQISSLDPSGASSHAEEICLDPERNSPSQQKEGPAPMHNTLFVGNG